MERRTFLTATLAASALTALDARARARPAAQRMSDGDVARLSPRAVRVRWSGAPVSIYASSDPDSPRGLMRPLRAAAGGAVELALAAKPRPYLLLATRDGRETRLAERLLPLAGGRNFRDLGGYRAEDGRQVRWGHIYRSGVMTGLTDADVAYLQALGIRAVCDLRNPRERTSEPSPFLKTDQVTVAAFDYDMSTTLSRLSGATTTDQAIDGFAESYVGFVETLTPHYADLFARLARDEAPLAFNCTAGKDRTGMASALVLSVLGVPRETVAADYALTETYTPAGFYKSQIASGGLNASVGPEQAKAIAQMPEPVLDVMMGSKPEVMRRALALVDRKYGGPIELARSRFGVTDAKRARLRELYLI